MRATLIATVLVGIAVGIFAPIPFLDVAPLQPEVELPSFAETRENIEDHDKAPPPPAYGENPERREIRKAVLHAASQLEFNPCSQNLRKKFAAAVRRFAESIEEGPREVILADGKEKNASKEYDKPAAQAIFKALMNGHIEPADLASSPLARRFVQARSGGGFPRKNPCAG